MKLLCILSVLLLASVEPAVSSSSSKYTSIFSFGDTFADTGNGRDMNAEKNIPDPTAKAPYGQTYPGYPTGRSTDGRLVIDFIAKGLLGLDDGLPPSRWKNETFSHGASFAVSAATALDISFFDDTPLAGKLSLDKTLEMQLKSFEKLKAKLCGTAQDCPESFFDRSLFFLGEFGVNDYSFAILGKNLSQVRSMVPEVVDTIVNATKGLLKHGAKTVVVPGIPPLGCTPPNLFFFPSADQAGYENGCLRSFNQLAQYHNSKLKKALKKLDLKYKTARVVYANFYKPVIQMVVNPARYNLTSEVLKCCCGGGGKYNFNIAAGCGMPGATVCKDPSKYVYWDGHFTEAANREIAKRWLDRIKSIGPVFRSWDVAKASA